MAKRSSESAAKKDSAVVPAKKQSKKTNTKKSAKKAQKAAQTAQDNPETKTLKSVRVVKVASASEKTKVLTSKDTPKAKPKRVLKADKSAAPKTAAAKNTAVKKAPSKAPRAKKQETNDNVILIKAASKAAKSPKAAKTSTASKTAKAPKTAKTSAASKAAKAPKAAKTTAAAEEAKTAEAIAANAATQTADTGEKPEAKSSPAVKGLGLSFGKKKQDEAERKNTKGAEFLPNTQSSKPQAELGLQHKKKQTNLKTTMEVPAFRLGTQSPEPGSELAKTPLTGELPEDYGETRLVLQVCAPHKGHAYWQIPQLELRKLEFEIGIFEFLHSHFVLKIHDVSHNGTEEIAIAEGAKDWFFEFKNPKTVYQAELGLQSPSEGYTFIALSNLVQTPADAVSDLPKDVIEQPSNIDNSPNTPKSACVSDAATYNEAQGIKLQANNTQISKGRKSGKQSAANRPNALQTPQDAQNNPVKNCNDAAPSSFVLAVPASEAPVNTAKSTDNGVYFWAKPEIILYGAAGEGCSVTFNGSPVKTRSDGTFTLRLALPLNMQKNIELKAVNPLTKQEKIICSAVLYSEQSKA